MTEFVRVKLNMLDLDVDGTTTAELISTKSGSVQFFQLLCFISVLAYLYQCAEEVCSCEKLVSGLSVAIFMSIFVLIK